MNARHFSDETLMAFADGELSPPELAEIAEAAEADPAIAERIEAFRHSRRMVSALFQPLANEPVPDSLMALLKANGKDDAGEAEIIPFRQRLRRSIAGQRWRELAVAASVAAVLAGAAMYGFDRMMGTGESPSTLAFGTNIGEPLASTLSRLPSGSEERWGNRRVKAIGTFTDRNGTLCRDFEYDLIGSDTYAAVACRADGSWSLAFAVRAAPATDDYAPASSQSALDSYLAAIEAGPLMSAEDERAALGIPQR